MCPPLNVSVHLFNPKYKNLNLGITWAILYLKPRLQPSSWQPEPAPKCGCFGIHTVFNLKKISYRDLKTSMKMQISSFSQKIQRSGDAGPPFLSGSNPSGVRLGQAGSVHPQPFLPPVEHLLPTSVMDLTCPGPRALELETFDLKYILSSVSGICVYFANVSSLSPLWFRFA